MKESWIHAAKCPDCIGVDTSRTVKGGLWRKKDPARLLLQGQFFYSGFAIGFCPQISNVIGQASVSFFEALKFEFCIFENDNKILVLLSKMRDLQGFWRKKRPCKIALARSIFLLWFYNLGLPQIIVYRPCNNYYNRFDSRFQRFSRAFLHSHSPKNPPKIMKNFIPCKPSIFE